MDTFVRRSPARLLTAGLLTLVTVAWALPAQAASARITVHASMATALVGSKVTLTGIATPAHGEVALQRLADGRWKTLSHATVSASGSYTLSLTVSRQAQTSTVRVTHAGAKSPTLAVHVVAHAFAVRTAAPAALPVGHRLTVTGTVSPAARGMVRLQQLRGATWDTVASARLSPTSVYQLHMTPSAGVVQLRVVAPASATRAAGTSKPFAVAVQVVSPAPVMTPPDPAPPATTPGPPLPAPPAQAPVVTTEEQSTYGTSGNAEALSGVGLSGPLQETWEDGVVGTPSSVVFGDGIVFVAGNAEAHAFVTALRVSDGSVLWGPYLLPGNSGETEGTLAYDAGRVFVGTDECTLAAFDATTGTLDWSHSGGTGGCGGNPIASGGRLYLGSLDVLDEATGASLWGAAADYGWGPAAVAGDKVVVNGGNLMPGVLDAATGKVLWSKPFTNVQSGHTAAVAGGKVYAEPVGSHTGTVYDLATGRQTGTFASDEQPAIDAAHDVMVTVTSDDPLSYACDSCTVHGRSVSTGRSLWQFHTRNGWVDPPLIIDGVVYLVDSAEIYALDEHTGALISSIDVHVQTFVHQGPEFAPVIAAGDGLLVVPVDGGLVALRSSSAAETAPVQEHEVTAGADCPNQRDVVFVSRTCTWAYPQLANGTDTLQLLWNADTRATITASVQDSTGHLYGTQTSSTGLIQLATTEVPAGGTIQVVVTDSGPDGGADYVSDFAGVEPHASVLPTATPSTTALGFGYVPLGTTSSESFTVRNTGGSDLLISKVTLNDPSSVTYSGVWDTCTGTVLPAGWSCTLRVVAHPQSTTTVTGSVVIATTDGQQADVTLSAAGG